jgi:uncharacterized protein
MEMTGEQLISASRERVWAGLNDPEVLKKSIEGCESLEKRSDTEMTAKVVARLGPVKAKFGGKVTLSDLDPPSGYTLTGEGNGAGAGFAKGVAKVRLADEDGATRLTYEVHADVSGKIAQIGSRLIEGSAKKMAADFFDRFSAEVSGATLAEVKAARAPQPSAAAGGGVAAAQPWWREPGWVAAGGVLAASVSMWVGFFIGRATARTDRRRL